MQSKRRNPWTWLLDKLADWVWAGIDWRCFLREEWLWVRKINGGGKVTPLVDATGHIYGLTAQKRGSMASIAWEDEQEAA